jgi:sortase A
MNYVEQLAAMDDATYERIWAEAQAYNQSLLQKSNRYMLSDVEWDDYNSKLAISSDEVMGYIEIPSIRCTLPIYHGTSDSALQAGVGHIPGTSLPIGGPSTHCVLSGHRGLPSAKLFTNLDKLVEGDLFMIQVLDTTLTYEVDQILIVEPEQMGALAIEEGQDYCTLVTCTPYGVNTHRLLVRGHRVENLPDELHVAADAMQLETILVAPLVAAPILFLLLIWLLVHYRRR